MQSGYLDSLILHLSIAVNVLTTLSSPPSVPYAAFKESKIGKLPSLRSMNNKLREDANKLEDAVDELSEEIDALEPEADR